MTDTSKATIAAVVERLRIKASMIMLGEPIAWGSDSAVMDEAASLISALEAERDEARSRLKEESREAFVGHKIVGRQKSLMLDAAAAINETLARAEAAEALNTTLGEKARRVLNYAVLGEMLDDLRFGDDDAFGIRLGDLRALRDAIGKAGVGK